jgi:hypothetical protein
MTPIIFLGLFLITGILMISVSDLDRKVVEGIENDNVLEGVYINYLENTTNQASLLFQATMDVVSTDSTITKQYVESSVNSKTSQSTTITSCNERDFTIQQEYVYNDNVRKTNITKKAIIERKITCIDIENYSGKKPQISCDSKTMNCK